MKHVDATKQKEQKEITQPIDIDDPLERLLYKVKIMLSKTPSQGFQEWQNRSDKTASTTGTFYKGRLCGYCKAEYTGGDSYTGMF